MRKLEMVFTLFVLGVHLVLIVFEPVTKCSSVFI